MKKKTQLLQILLAAVLGVAVLATFFVKETVARDFFGEFNLVRILVYVLFIGLVLYIFRTAPKIDLKSFVLPTKKLICF